ncbi:auxin-responsive protein SAUR71-like [Spinacia oleracea]|uniref:Auxin-responsive protein SAUR71-like n=1 Tax=Spinacia oleracea TaxID=3562 RepID=A0ABM3R9D1_SPIOL|nr:auxin-responsive protein SAUR71-like [Spinacia oleracea]
MKDLIGRIVRKKEQSSSSSSSSSSSATSTPPRYSRLSCYDKMNNNNHQRHETQKTRGYVPIMVGKCEEEEERFMVPLGWMSHPCIVDLLQLSVNEFGYRQQGVLQIPCEPHHFRHCQHADQSFIVSNAAIHQHNNNSNNHINALKSKQASRRFPN